jgi:hypothetical protein
MALNDLIEELVPAMGESVARSALVALGAAPDASIAFDELLASAPDLDAHFIEYGDDVLTMYLLSCGRAIRHELTREGAHLTVVVGVDRIRRVFEQFAGGELTVGVELDADRRSFEFSSVKNPAGEHVSVGSETNVGWVLASSDPGVRARLMVFASALRLALVV